MDIASVGGILLAIIGVVGGLMMEGGSIAQVTQPTAMMIVLGGTMGAVMLQFPLNIFVAAFRQSVFVFFVSGKKNEDTIAQIVCRVVASYIAGDHTIFLGEVQSADLFPGEPLIFFGSHYRELVPPR